MKLTDALQRLLNTSPVIMLWVVESLCTLSQEILFCRFVQHYAAAVTAFQELKDIPRAIVLDIGGYTADYLQIRNGAGDLAVCDSLEQGVILLYNKVKSRARAENDVLLSEAEIDDILMGRQSAARAEIMALAENLAQECVANLMNTLREHQLELKSGCVVFVGGGSLLLRNQIEGSGKVGRMIFVEDVRANAKGYELLYTDGSEELRTLGYFDNFGLKPFREGKQTAIYRLGNYEISFPVFYREQKLTRVEPLRFGKTEYLEGELIDNNDFLARASYSDGSEKTVRLQCKAKASPNMDSVQMRYGRWKLPRQEFCRV